MEIRVLGCSGGIGLDRRTTSLLIDDDILIDSGSGVGDLSLDEMASIRHIFLTHSHLDHITLLPLMVDSIFERIKSPIIIHGQPPTLKALQDHIFNWHIWPDFAKLPTPENPVMAYETLLPGQTFELGRQRRLEMIPVNHIVPGVGYRIENLANGKCFAYSGDTTTNDTFWDALNRHGTLDLLFVEAAFSNQEEALSVKAKHYCSNTLAADLVKLTVDPRPDVFITHTKPGDEADIMTECTQLLPQWQLAPLKGGDRFKL